MNTLESSELEKLGVKQFVDRKIQEANINRQTVASFALRVLGDNEGLVKLQSQNHPHPVSAVLNADLDKLKSFRSRERRLLVEYLATHFRNDLEIWNSESPHHTISPRVRVMERVVDYVLKNSKRQ